MKKICKHGWILLNLADFQIWKIKPNGDNLTQVTPSTNTWFHPEVNFTGDKFIAYRGYASPNASLVFDLDGNPLDTIPSYFVGGDWKHHLFYGSIENNNIRIFDMSTSEQVSMYCWPNMNETIDDFCWVSETEGIISNMYGIYRINPWSGSTTKLMCTCNSQRYSWSSTNSDKSKIIYTRTISTPIGSNTLRVDRSIVLMSSNAENMEVLDLD